jgi:hypothetical protein
MNKQDAMFTSEQMRGSGQSDMVALIHNNEDRKADLRQAPHNFHADPSHGWLQVCFDDLTVLGILGAITGYSYRDGDIVYLEEDYDAEMYINALFGKKGERTQDQQTSFAIWGQWLNDTHSNSDSFIRNLPQFYK